MLWGLYMTIEKISDENIIDIYKNDIELYISMFCEENNLDISDIYTMSQNRFNAVLYYLYNKIFKNIDLKDHKTYNNGLFVNTTHNSYNIPLLEEIAEIYIYYCDLYDKIANINGFCRLTGVAKETIFEWGRDDGRKASRRTSDLWKKLSEERERALSDRLVSGKGNPVGILGALNHWHNWAGVGNMTEKKTDAATLADVQRKAALLSDNSGRDQDENGEKPVIELSDNLTQLKTP